ncbi:MAG: DHA2 family efflux MFS transporter permease subunit [Bdellovibrionota bacterium]
MTVQAEKIADLTPIPQASQAVPDWEMTPQDWAAVVGMALGAFMAILDIQITNASLREIQGALGLDFAEGGWISTAYLIAEIIVIPLTGFLSKVFGMRRYVLVNCVIFVIASLLCGISWNLSSMIAFRVLQGLSGGILIPMSFQAMLLFMPPQRKAIGLAIFGMTATLAPTLGPSLGGWLTENISWRANFMINLVPGAIMILLISYGMPLAATNFEKLKKMDVLGTLTMALGMGTLTYILEEGSKVQWFEDELIQICTLICIGSMASFMAIQLLRKDPLLNLRLFLDRNFGLSALITMLSAIALYGGIYALSLYLGQIQNYGALQIGQVMMWVGIPQLFVMPMVPWLMKKVDPRILVVAGMGLFAYSNLINSQLNMDFAGEQFRFSLIIRAIGQPLFVIPLSALAMGMIHPGEAGNASSIYNVMRNLGGSIGIAMAGTFLVGRQALHAGQVMAKLGQYDSLTNDRLSMIQTGLMIAGQDSQSARAGATKLLVGIAQREAIIQSFGDVFWVISVLLGLCILMVLLLRNDGNQGAGGAPHH